MTVSFTEDLQTPVSVYSGLSERAEATLRQAGLIHADVHCSIDGDELTLTGCVGSFYEKQIAQETIRNVYGVRQVSNQLSVRG